MTLIRDTDPDRSVFHTITPDDWRRSLQWARSPEGRRNLVREQIRVEVEREKNLAGSSKMEDGRRSVQTTPVIVVPIHAPRPLSQQKL